MLQNSAVRLVHSHCLERDALEPLANLEMHCYCSQAILCIEFHCRRTFLNWNKRSGIGKSNQCLQSVLSECGCHTNVRLDALGIVRPNPASSQQV